MAGEEENTKTLVILPTALKDMQKNLRGFSSSMQALYSDKNILRYARVGHNLPKLRDDTKDDAKIYSKVILPLTIQFISSINDFFHHYKVLAYEEWCEKLPNIIENIKKHKEFAETLVKLYENIIAALKKREDESKRIIRGFKNQQHQHNAITNELEAKANTKRKWKYGLAFVPVVNIVACPLLKISESRDREQANAEKAKSRTCQASARVVAQTFSPILSNFLQGLENAAGFFENVEKELKSFQKNETPSSEVSKLKKGHYLIMNKNIENIQLSCQAFNAAVPDVRSDLESIPDKDTQQNYIDKWLKKESVEIRKASTSTRMAILDVIKEIPGFRIKANLLLSYEPANSKE